MARAERAATPVRYDPKILWTIQEAAQHWVNPRTHKNVTVGWVRQLVRRSCDPETGAPLPNGPIRGVTMKRDVPTPFYQIPQQPFPALPMGRPVMREAAPSVKPSKRKRKAA